MGISPPAATDSNSARVLKFSAPLGRPAPSRFPPLLISGSFRPWKNGPFDYFSFDCLSKVVDSIGFSRSGNQRYQRYQSGGTKTALKWHLSRWTLQSAIYDR